MELDNPAGVAGYGAIEKWYVDLLLSSLIALTHQMQQKERQRPQRVRA